MTRRVRDTLAAAKWQLIEEWIVVSAIREVVEQIYIMLFSLNEVINW